MNPSLSQAGGGRNSNHGTCVGDTRPSGQRLPELGRCVPRPCARTWADTGGRRGPALGELEPLED